MVSTYKKSFLIPIILLSGCLFSQSSLARTCNAIALSYQTQINTISQLAEQELHMADMYPNISPDLVAGLKNIHYVLKTEPAFPDVKSAVDTIRGIIVPAGSDFLVNDMAIFAAVDQGKKDVNDWSDSKNKNDSCRAINQCMLDGKTPCKIIKDN